MVRDVIILSAQNQRVAYKLASQEYLGFARDQRMPGPFPAPPIFWGKSPGDEVGMSYDWPVKKAIDDLPVYKFKMHFR